MRQGHLSAAQRVCLPIIALKDDALTDVTIDNKNGFLVKQQSPKLFAQKIITLLDDPSLYEKFSTGAVKTAQNFSEKNVAKKLTEIYKAQIEKRYQIKG